MDIKNAFLHDDLQENVFMKFPQGYLGAGHRLQVSLSDDSKAASIDDKVCKLDKSLYGFKQAPSGLLSLATHLRIQVHPIKVRLLHVC